MSIDEITILPGHRRDGKQESFNRITIRAGEIVSIVGSTGSGKTALINDIEVFARKDTVTGRTVLINGDFPDDALVRDPSRKPIALISQNTKCLADLTVSGFLEMHVRARKIGNDRIVERTVALANEFTGEGIANGMRMTSLSGGQTRSLLIADAIEISNAPLILLDEVESGGIFKDKVMTLLEKYGKSVLFVTHDPLLALLAGRRIIMKNGGIEQVLVPGNKEQAVIDSLSQMNEVISSLRERVRAGEILADARCPA
ncbi:MAG: ATP-binding cassette domain-containing protein [Methanoregulaceae archaeon]